MTHKLGVGIGPAFEPFPIAYGPELHFRPFGRKGKARDLIAVTLFSLLIDYLLCALFGFGEEVNEVRLFGLSARLGH